MPHSIQYQITRSVAPGYTLGALNTFAPALREKDRGRKASRKRVMSLGAVPFTTYYHGSTTWQLETTPMTETQAEVMRMFLDSVEDGQVFYWDPKYAPAHTPNAYRAVILDGDTYQQDRKVKRGDGGEGDLFTFTLRLLEVAG
jgi:hypothetical protein